MIPEITLHPLQSTPLLGALVKRSTHNLSDTQLDPARDLNQGVALALTATEDTAHLQPSPITIAPLDPSYMDKYFLTKNNQYPNIFLNMALGLENDGYYKAFFAQDMGRLFGDGEITAHVSQQLDALVAEMKANFDAGMVVAAKDLKTKFCIGGAEFSFDEMLQVKGAMEYAENLIGGRGTKDYSEYADVGIAIGYVGNMAKGISADQSDVVTARVLEMAEESVKAAFSYIEKGSSDTDAQGNGSAFYSNRGIATNQAHAQALIDLFSELDYADGGAVNRAVQRFGELMQEARVDRPVSDRYVPKLMAEAHEKIAGRKEYERMTVHMLRKRIEESADKRRMSALSTAQPESEPKEFVKRPEENLQDIRQAYAKNVYQAVEGKTYNSRVEQIFGSFRNSMSAFYQLLEAEYTSNGEWSQYYRDAVEGDSEMKARAARIGSNVVDGFKNSAIGSDYNWLLSNHLTEEEEALAYRVYGDTFLQDKAAYYEKAQQTVVEAAYTFSKQFELGERIMLDQAQDSMGEGFNIEEYKLSFKAYLHKENSGDFLSQLAVAIEALGGNSRWLAKMMEDTRSDGETQ